LRGLHSFSSRGDLAVLDLAALLEVARALARSRSMRSCSTSLLHVAADLGDDLLLLAQPLRAIIARTLLVELGELALELAEALLGWPRPSPS
jgi:hypothetical protein